MTARQESCATVTGITAWLRASGLTVLPILRQATTAECGLACLAMIAGFYGHRSDLPELRRKNDVSGRGLKLTDMISIAAKLNLSSRPLRCELRNIGRLRTPCILHWEFGHFVVLRKFKRGVAHIHDPAKGVVNVRMSELDRLYTGVALELSPTDSFRKKSSPLQLALSHLMRFDRFFISNFSLGLMLSLLSEILLLTSPFYLQTVIDEVLLKGDVQLLDALAIGFAIIVVLELVSNVLRRLTFQFLGNVLSFDMSARVFHQIMSLPIGYFRNRQLGDLQHRVQSLNQIQHFIANVAPQIVVDMIFVSLIVTIMYMYAPILTSSALGIGCVYVLWRIAAFRIMRRAAGDLIIAEAQTQTLLLESLRTMPSLKMMAIESQRESDWQNVLARKLNAHIRVGNLSIVNFGVGHLLFQSLRVAVIYVAARQIFAGTMSIGMMSAYVVYFGMFNSRFLSIVDRVVEFKLLQVPLNRLADIVFSETEKSGSDGGRGREFSGGITVNQMAFRYSANDDWVLRACNLNIAPGEIVVVRGPSGTGKSTLLRLIAGLERATSGTVLFDGLDSSRWDSSALRKGIGVVLQEEPLLKGTLAENIGLFSPDINMDKVREAARLASISSEIESFPMGYETAVGDMGSSLSMGQKQRILLARALYKQPRLLLLDEATSNLDSVNEGAILAMLKRLGTTCVLISHRAETEQIADRVVHLENGMIFPVGNVSAVNTPLERTVDCRR